MARGGVFDIDAVLTTRELSRLIRMRGLELDKLPPDSADTPFGERTTAGKLFGASGGVMEAALRTAHYLLSGEDLEDLTVQAVRGSDGIKEAYVSVDGLKIGVAVANGLSKAKELLEQIRKGRDDLHFIEVMTCPGGCVAGGGQPIGGDIGAIKGRMQALYKLDRSESLRTSHSNQGVKRLYSEYLGAPLSEISHKLLHTHYVNRAALKRK